MNPEKSIGRVPWLTKDGFFDPAKFPIDSILKQTLDTDEHAFRSGVGLLQSMCVHGRREAGIFLLGLLLASDDNLERRGVIVEALRNVPTKPCADLLFAELRRVKSSNTTRRYLASVIKVLASLPAELVVDGFAELADDKSFSQKMRGKFRAVICSGPSSGDDWY
ncbi:MAG: hypothetical protein A2W31_13030 [Planctomycetes bacterium RBG_16_64_10]|nr:MAG: hypothetical protein A2W31_13030 [Planctomycetes bacterium RBG_16_64_10]